MKRILASLLGMYAFCVLTTADSAQLILRPEATYSTTNLSRYPASGGYADKIWEETADNDATYIYVTGASSGLGRFDLPDHTTQAGVINSVTAYWRYRGTATGGQTQGGFYFSSSGYGGYLTGETRTLNTYWTTWSFTANQRPGGGSWTWGEIDDLTLVVTLKSPTDGTQARCTQAWVVVNYTPPTPTPTVTPTATQTPTPTNTPTVTPTATPTPCHDAMDYPDNPDFRIDSTQATGDDGWLVRVTGTADGDNELGISLYDKENSISIDGATSGNTKVVITKGTEDIAITSPYTLTTVSGDEIKIYLPDLPPAP